MQNPETDKTIQSTPENIEQAVDNEIQVLEGLTKKVKHSWENLTKGLDIVELKINLLDPDETVSEDGISLEELLKAMDRSGISDEKKNIYIEKMGLESLEKVKERIQEKENWIEIRENGEIDFTPEIDVFFDEHPEYSQYKESIAKKIIEYGFNPQFITEIQTKKEYYGFDITNNSLIIFIKDAHFLINIDDIKG